MPQGFPPQRGPQRIENRQFKKETEGGEGLGSGRDGPPVGTGSPSECENVLEADAGGGYSTVSVLGTRHAHTEGRQVWGANDTPI